MFRKRIILIIVIAVGLLMILLGLSVLQKHNRNNAPVKVSNQLTSQILSNDTTTSYNLLSDTAKKNITQDDWTALASKLSNFFKGQSPQFASKDVSASIAIVKYTIKGSDGNYLMTVTLEPVGRDWRVQSFTSTLQTQ